MCPWCHGVRGLPRWACRASQPRLLLFLAAPPRWTPWRCAATGASLQHRPARGSPAPAQPMAAHQDEASGCSVRQEGERGDGGVSWGWALGSACEPLGPAVKSVRKLGADWRARKVVAASVTLWKGAGKWLSGSLACRAAGSHQPPPCPTSPLFCPSPLVQHGRGGQQGQNTTCHPI